MQYVSLALIACNSLNYLFHLTFYQLAFCIPCVLDFHVADNLEFSKSTIDEPATTGEDGMHFKICIYFLQTYPSSISFPLTFNHIPC